MHPRRLHPHHLISDMCLVLLVALLFASAAASIFFPSAVASILFPSVANANVPHCTGCFHPVDVSHPKWIQLAEFAVSEYNKKQWPSRRLLPQNSRLVFQNLVGGEWQLVAGLNHKLFIRAVNESLPAGSPPLIYEATVYESWRGIKELTSFVRGENSFIDPIYWYGLWNNMAHGGKDNV